LIEVAYIVISLILAAGFYRLAADEYKCNREMAAYEECFEETQSEGYCINKHITSDCEDRD
jgi:hypothetical protein